MPKLNDDADPTMFSCDFVMSSGETRTVTIDSLALLYEMNGAADADFGSRLAASVGRLAMPRDVAEVMPESARFAFGTRVLRAVREMGKGVGA